MSAVMYEHSPDELLSIGDVAQRTGVARSALHYYEQLGLIAAQRTVGNQRRYPRYMVRRISLLLVAKRLGVPLSDVQEAFASLPMDRKPTPREWRRVSKVWRTSLEVRRRQIERLERELTGCIGCGCLSMTACQLLNPDDELSERGPGPQRLTETGERLTGKGSRQERR
ncbi:MAG: redox-sensitive transcriptional activator SoxR [Propionibacteriales bacterium]|nr:redox-sensitive transcriptional activator SoxR [Propionibacteriales bacterium]